MEVLSLNRRSANPTGVFNPRETRGIHAEKGGFARTEDVSYTKSYKRLMVRENRRALFQLWSKNFETLGLGVVGLNAKGTLKLLGVLKSPGPLKRLRMLKYCALL